MLTSTWTSVIFLCLFSLNLVEVTQTTACAFYCFVSPEANGTFEVDSYRNLSCTHFVYGFSRIRQDMSLRGVTARDNLEVTSPGNLRKFLGLRNTHPHSTLLLGIHLLSHDVLQDIRHIREASKNLVDIVRKKHFDGLFIHMEGPILESAISQHFLMALSMESSSPPFRKTLAVSARWMWRVADKLNELVDYVDHIYLIMEELPSSEDEYSVSQLDPLMPSDSIPLEDTISGCINTMLSKGVPAEKIIVGLSSGGRTYKVYNSESTVHGDIAIKSSIRQSLQDICQISRIYFDSNAASAVVLQSKTSWTSLNYPKEQSLGKKIQWIAREGLGGVGLSSLQLDDPMGKCEVGQYPSHRMVGKILKCRARDHPRSPSAQCTRLCYLDDSNADQFNLWSILPHWCSHFVIGPCDIQFSDNVEISTSVKDLISRIQEWIRTSDDNNSKIILSIGAQQSSDIWRVELGTSLKRKNLINNIKNIVRAMNVSGVEISWTLEPLDAFMDSSLLSQFLIDLDTVMPKGIEVLFSVNPDSSFNSRYDINVINSTTDLIVMQTHRLYNSRQSFTGHHSPLFIGPGFRDNQMSVEVFVKDWISRGVPREKLILSVTTIPTVLSLVEQFDNDTDINVFGLPAIPIPSTRSNQIVSQTKICETLQSIESRVYWIEESAVPVLIHNSEFIAFDNEKSAKIKAIWGSINNLGGLAIHGLSQDNPNGDCPDRPFPILQSIVDTQVCTICASVNESKASKCTTSFLTVCNYRLPENDEAQRLDPKNIPFERCDEVVVEHAVIDANSTIGFMSGEQHNVLKQLIGLRSRMKNVVISLRCEMEKDDFALLMQSRAKRMKMATSIRSFVDDHSMDGVELRCADLITKFTKQQFAHFLRLLKKEMKIRNDNECGKTVSVRLSAWHTDLRENYDVTVLNSLHHVVLEPFSVPLLPDAAFVHSPLFPVDISDKSTTSIDSAIRNWEKAGLKLSKILLQIPSYGMEQSLVNSTNIGIGKPTEKEYAIIGQDELCQRLKYTGTTRKTNWDSMTVTAYTIGGKWISIDDQQTVKYKMRYALREGLAGVGLMSLNEDDHMGTCGSGVFPILRSISLKCY